MTQSLCCTAEIDNIVNQLSICLSIYLSSIYIHFFFFLA